MKERHQYIRNRVCPFCEIINDGWCITTDLDYKEIKRDKLSFECGCSREKTLKKIKDKCCVCNKRTKKVYETEDQRIRRYLTYGNFCQACCVYAEKVAKGVEEPTK